MSEVHHAAVAGFDFEPEHLRAFLEAEMPELRGPMRAERIGGGQSNPTYFISFDNREMVLRKRPPGELPKSAHDVAREYRLIRALFPTRVPVPEPILFRDSPEVVGTPFYLMGRVHGRIFHDASAPSLTPEQRRELYRAYARALAQLHALDWRALGLEAFARPGSFLTRQVDRWGRAFGEGDPKVERIVGWLRDNLPASERLTLVHGDFKFNNLVFHPDRPELVGVLDWELATIGDPMTDLATNWAFLWETAPQEYGGIRGLDLDHLGIPDAETYFEDYYAASGASDRVQTFHKVLALLRNAGIFRGIGERHAAGIAAAADAADAAKLEQVFVARALTLIETSAMVCEAG